MSDIEDMKLMREIIAAGCKRQTTTRASLAYLISDGSKRQASMALSNML